MPIGGEMSCGLEIALPTVQRMDLDFQEVDVDAGYKVFLKHLRRDGCSYAFEMRNEVDGSTTFVKYEGDNHERNRPCDLDDIDVEYDMFLRHLRPDGNSYILEMSDSIDGSTIHVKYEGVCKRHLGIRRNSSINPTERKGCHSGKTTEASSEGIDPHPYPMRQKEKWTSHDQSYQIFLDHVRTHGRSMILELDNGISITYEGGNEPLDASESTPSGSILCLDKNSEPREYSPFNSSMLGNEYDCSFRESLDCRSSSDFKDNLMAALTKPADRKEYKYLLEEANKRKPVQKEKHLRGNSITYDTKYLGYSYLDRYPELEKLIESAGWQNGLILLRGFFFWLQNLCHEGAFQPWLPSRSSCEALPACHIAVDDDD